MNIAAKAIAEAGVLRSTGHAIAGAAIFAADPIHTGIRGAFIVVIAIEPVV